MKHLRTRRVSRSGSHQIACIGPVGTVATGNSGLKSSVVLPSVILRRCLSLDGSRRASDRAIRYSGLVSVHVCDGWARAVRYNAIPLAVWDSALTYPRVMAR